MRAYTFPPKTRKKRKRDKIKQQGKSSGRIIIQRKTPVFIACLGGDLHLYAYPSNISIVSLYLPLLLLANVILLRQANERPFPRNLQLESSRYEILEHLPRIVLLRRRLDLPECHIPIPAERILILEGVVDVLEILQRPGALQVRGQIGEDAVGQAPDLGVVFGAHPGHVEEEEYVVVGVAVEAEDVAAAL